MSEKLALDALFRRAGAPRRPTVVLTRKSPPNLPSNMAPSLRRVEDHRGQLYRESNQEPPDERAFLQEQQAELDDEAQFMRENPHYEPHLRKLVDARPPRPAGKDLVYCRHCGDKVKPGQLHYAGNNPENGPRHKP